MTYRPESDWWFYCSASVTARHEADVNTVASVGGRRKNTSKVGSATEHIKQWAASGTIASEAKRIRQDLICQTQSQYTSV